MPWPSTGSLALQWTLTRKTIMQMQAAKYQGVQHGKTPHAYSMAWRACMPLGRVPKS